MYRCLLRVIPFDPLFALHLVDITCTYLNLCLQVEKTFQMERSFLVDMGNLLEFRTFEKKSLNMIEVLYVICLKWLKYIFLIFHTSYRES